MGVRTAVLAAAILMVAGCTLRPDFDRPPELASGVSTPRGLEVRFLGVSSFLISDGDISLVFDGFVTRPSAETVLFGSVSSDPALVDRYILSRLRGELAAVFVAHTHFDHALDVATLAQDPSVAVYGSSDVRAILPSGRGFTELVERRPVTFGAFKVTAFRTEHSPRDLASGRMSEPLATPARARAYKTGLNHAFLVQHQECRILIVPSAGPIGQTFKDARADVVFLSFGRLGRQGAPAFQSYWADTVAATGAGLVVPVHWDDPSLSLDDPLVASPYLVDRVDLAFGMVADNLRPPTQFRLARADTVLDFSDLNAGACA